MDARPLLPLLTETDTTDEHFLGHVVESAHRVQASEDILTAGGMKLLAKGAPVDHATRERLLAHKLARPLEQCLEVADAIGAQTLAPLAEKLFDEQPLLRTLHGEARGAESARALARLTLPRQLRSLLTLYAELPSDKLQHCAIVALLASGLARKVLPDAESQERTLLTAGLFHDVGELYLDPAVLQRGAKMDTAQWKHIVVHPLVGHRVLRDMDGAGALVAEAVLHHHERRDGFGYPKGLSQDAIPRRSEILAAAEWLAGLMRHGHSPVTSAEATSKIVPGSFSDAILRAIAPSADAPVASAAPAGRVLERLARVSGTVERFHRWLPWIEEQIGDGTPASALIAANHVRMKRIERSFVSSGLAGEAPQAVLDRLNAHDDPKLLAEIEATVREIGWRLRELERDTLLRATALPPEGEQLVRRLVSRLKQHEPDDA